MDDVARQVWGVLGAVAGATLRGWIGPGSWDWGEWWRGCVTAAIFVIWIAPGIAEWFELGPNALIGLGCTGGMVALPLARAVVFGARAVRDRAEHIAEHLIDRLLNGNDRR